MAKLIGLASGFHDIFLASREEPDFFDRFFDRTKQRALFFDKIGFFNLDINMKLLRANLERDGKEFPELEYEWLRENEIIFDLNDTPLEEEIVQGSEAKSLISALEKRPELAQSIEIYGLEKATTMEWDALETIIMRLISINLETTQNVSTVTMLPYINYTQEIPNGKKSDAVQIVINKLPLPNNITPWEQIIDYRSDPANQKNLLALRRWIRKISSENLSRAEIEEEFEFLVNEFEEYMKLHRIKANTETLEAVVKAPLEIIEGLVKLKFSNITEPLFSLKKRQLVLMEAEINAPGKELVYFIKTKDTFQSQE